MFLPHFPQITVARAAAGLVIEEVTALKFYMPGRVLSVLSASLLPPSQKHDIVNTITVLQVMELSLGATEDAQLLEGLYSASVATEPYPMPAGSPAG